MFMAGATFDENDVVVDDNNNDDLKEEFLCPFCSEYFDIVGLCCHIDEDHPLEAKNGVCMYAITKLLYCSIRACLVALQIKTAC